MEKKYIAELGKKYLVFPYECEDYSIRMLTENQIPGCVHGQVRHLNGEDAVYYDVTGLQALTDLYGSKEMGSEICKSMLVKAVEVRSGLGEYFLEERALCLDPEYIFYDVKEMKYAFLPLPMMLWEREGEEKALLNFVVDHMEHKNVAFTEKIYAIYRDVYRGEGLDVSGLLELKTVEPKREPVEAPVWQEEAPEEEIEFKSENMELRKDDMRGEKQKKKSRKVEMMLLATVLIFVAALCYYMGLTMLSFLGFACMEAGGYGIYRYLQGKNKKASVEYREEEYLPATPLLADVSEPYDEFAGEYDEEFSPENAEERGLEATVYEEIRVEEEYVLYPINKKGKEIKLVHFPFTIGKSKEFCDHVLEDKGISRLHARFTKSGEDAGVYVEDLDSTNGVYHNGLRILPGEEVLLEPEDEIQFGKLRYVYR